VTAAPDLNVVAVYGNDTITIGKFGITPGIRCDHTDRNGDFTSPSLGITYELATNTILRGCAARGFHLPNIGATVSDGVLYRHNPDLKPEKVWSYQAGIESGVLKYIWLKVFFFRHDISDAIVDVDLDPDAGTWTAVNTEKVRRQGIEAEMRTRKFHHVTLSGGVMYQHSKDLVTGDSVHEQPDYAYSVIIKYDKKSFRALLKGRYVWWQNVGGTNPKSDFIMDVNLIKTFIRKENRMYEVYLTGHNIFDGSQYWDELFKNAGRWVEAGIRVKF
jgi:vitamin B12 transporter